MESRLQPGGCEGSERPAQNFDVGVTGVTWRANRACAGIIAASAQLILQAVLYVVAALSRMVSEFMGLLCFKVTAIFSRSNTAKGT